MVLASFVHTSLVWSAIEVTTLKKGVVKVTAKFSDKQKVGTGFIAGRGKKYLYIVTASHVIEEGFNTPQSISITFFTQQEETLSAKLVKKEGGDPRGLALLKVGGELPEDVQVLEWDTSSRVQGGEEIHLIGFPQIGGNPWAVTKGILSGFDGPILKLSGTVAVGNSGGPVFLGEKVIGVVMEVTGQFANAKPAQIAQFTVENWPGFPQQVVQDSSPAEPESSSTGVIGTPQPSQSSLASLVIASSPSDAKVFVEDELVGLTRPGPVVVDNLYPDEYEVVVKKKGYRAWVEYVDLLPGERRELTAKMQKGSEIEVTGVWRNPLIPSISYVLEQTGDLVKMREVTTSVLGNMVTAEGEGQLRGHQLHLTYRTAVGTMGESNTSLSSDGQQLSGIFRDFSNMVPITISLMRTGDSPSSFSFPGAGNFNPLQNFGQ